MQVNFMGSSIGAKTLYATGIADFKSAPSPDGKFDWYYTHRTNTKKGGVQIVPIIHTQKGDEVVFIETVRPPIKAEGVAETCIEVPAGLIADEDKGESTEDAMEKELLQETGYSADNFKINMKNVSSSPGITSEINAYAEAHIYNDKQVQEPQTDGGVIQQIHRVPMENVMNWLKEQSENGKSISALTLTALSFIFDRNS